MRLRTFSAPDRYQAVRKMREAMGEDAVILSERETRSGVEIRAGLEERSKKKRGWFGFGKSKDDDRVEPIVAPNSDSRNEPSYDEPPKRRAADRDADIERAPEAQPEPRKIVDKAGLNQELEQRIAQQVLQHLRSNLTSKDGARGAISSDDPVMRELRRAIGDHSLGDALLAAVAAKVSTLDTDNEVHALATAFDDIFRFAPLQLTPLQPIMLCGPTGAGKTSSAAKLAARAIAAGSKAALFTADIGRAGAVEQLRTYAEALDAAFVPVEAPADVRRALASGQHRGCVILDTPGVSPFDGGDMAALKSFLEAADAEPLLVLPTSGDPSEHADWAQAFSEFGAKRIILTKFDATRRVGAGVGAAFAHGYALAHFSDTAFIGEGIRDATPEFLARRLLAAAPGRLLDEEDVY